MAPATRRIVVVVVGVVLALSALGAAIVLAVRGGESAGPATSLPAAGSTGPSTTAVAAPLAPLTGLPADPVSSGRPALVVKIDDVDPAARPQGGLEQADVVYEEKIEGPNSRFAVVFQSTGAAQVGPVRSGRTTDLAIVGPLNRPLYAFSGANATFLGWLEGDALAEAYASADLFCFPSRTDTFGQVILEAQASGLPVVAVAEGGPRQLVENGVTGLLRPARADAIADALVRLAASPERRRRLADAARQEVAARTWERSMERLAAGYRRALDPPVAEAVGVAA